MEGGEGPRNLPNLKFLPGCFAAAPSPMQHTSGGGGGGMLSGLMGGVMQGEFACGGAKPDRSVGN